MDEPTQKVIDEARALYKPIVAGEETGLGAVRRFGRISKRQ